MFHHREERIQLDWIRLTGSYGPRRVNQQYCRIAVVSLTGCLRPVAVKDSAGLVAI